MKPNLKIVPTSEILPLTGFSEKKVIYLKNIIENSESIKNPLALAAVEHKYLLLEDAALLEAIRRANIHFVPAQVIRLKKNLKIYANLFAKDPVDSCLDDFQARFPRSCRFVNESATGDFNNSHTIFAPGSGKQDEKVLAIKKTGAGYISPLVFDFLEYLACSCTLIEKIFPSEWRAVNLKKHDPPELLRITNLTGTDLRFSGMNGYLLPSGSLRVEFGSRIIGINFPVRVLNEGVPAHQKEQFLYDLVNFRLKSGFSEYIKSGVYLLNY
nr:hypothetical protein [candidate division Zixibacteria bacterium]